MQQTIKLIDEKGKVFTKTVNTRNKELFEATIKMKAQTFRPKKGKGSYNRQQTKKEIYNERGN